MLLVLGAFEVIHPPKWTTNLASWFAEEQEWPRLPGAMTRAPNWIKKARTPVEINSFFDQPPREDNAQSDYLYALSEFDGAMADCFPPNDRSRRREIAQSRMERFRKAEDDWRLDPSTDDALDSVLEEYNLGFIKLMAAQAYHRCVFQVGVGDRSQLPHVEAAKEVERVTALRVARKLEQGDIKSSIDDFQVVLRLFRDIRSRGVLSTQIASLEAEAKAETEILLPILRQPGLSIEDCDKLVTILQAHASDGLDPFVEGSRAEYVKFGQILHACLDPKIGEDSSDASIDGSLPDPATRKKFDEFLVGKVPDDFIESAHRAYDDFHRTIHGHHDKGLLERIEHAHHLHLTNRLRHQSLEFAPDLGSLLENIGKAETTRNAMKCLVALQRWKLTGHPFNDNLSLEEVIKATPLLKVVPPDPFHPDGGPLKLVIDQGEPIIDSIGHERKDLDIKPGENPRGSLNYRLRPTTGSR
jgi:hypothetical protein